MMSMATERRNISNSTSSSSGQDSDKVGHMHDYGLPARGNGIRARYNYQLGARNRHTGKLLELTPRADSAGQYSDKVGHVRDYVLPARGMRNRNESYHYGSRKRRQRDSPAHVITD